VSTLESSVEAYLKAQVEKRGGWCVKFVPFYQAGLPDRICFLPGGRIHLVELKRPKTTRLRHAQERVRERLAALHIDVQVINSRELVDQYIERTFT
jgi:hypothetical protein